MRQLLAQGLLAVEGNYQTFALTEASREVLRGEREVRMRRDPERPAQPQPVLAKARAGGAAAGGGAGVRAAAGLARRHGEGAGRARRT